MKKTPISRRGKANQYWYECKQKLKQEFMAKGITKCEICGKDFALSFHHRHKRRYYLGEKKKLLGSFNEVILLDAFCHDRLEYDKELTKQWFIKLRK